MSAIRNEESTPLDKIGFAIGEIRQGNGEQAIQYLTSAWYELANGKPPKEDK